MKKNGFLAAVTGGLLAVYLLSAMAAGRNAAVVSAAPARQERQKTTADGGASEKQLSKGRALVSEGSDNEVSGNGVSGNRISARSLLRPSGRWSVSGNGVSGNSVSGNSVSGNGMSDSIVSDNSTSANTISGNGVSENSVSENSVSENSISENSVSGSSISGSSISGNSISANDFFSPLGIRGGVTLAQRQKVMNSHKATMQANQKDRQTLSENSIDFSEIRIACLGDSITEAVNLDKLENYRELAYPHILKEALGAQEVYNLGIGGSSIGRYWADAFVDRYRKIPDDTDLILVMGGTNDGFCASLVEFGTSSERKRRTFWGDLDELMDGVEKDYPNAEVIFLTPLPNNLHDYLKKDHPYLISQGKYAEVIAELAAEHGMEVIDLYNSNILDGHDKDNILHFMPDGVHPNAEGYRILGEHIAADIIRILNARREED